jgi:hypothetical protein
VTATDLPDAAEQRVGSEHADLVDPSQANRCVADVRQVARDEGLL